MPFGFVKYVVQGSAQTMYLNPLPPPLLALSHSHNRGIVETTTMPQWVALCY